MGLAEMTITIGLRWRDMDMLGHLNQAVYHELLEEGRTALMSTAGAGFSFVLARVELDYLAEVRPADREVQVLSRVTELGSRKVVLGQEVRRGDQVVARGTCVIVCWDADARASRPLTDQERRAFGG